MREVTVHYKYCIVHSLYVLVLAVLFSMYILYIIPGPTQLSLLPSATNWGPKGPLLCCPAGHFIISTCGQEQERVTLLLGPRVHLVKTFVYIYPRPPVASNPKKSQSRRLQHSCIVLFVLAYFKCFLGALACGLFL